MTATKCLAKSSPAAWKAAAASSMPLRVSTVPPDFEITTTSVCAELAAEPVEHESMPSGSVLSKKWTPHLVAAALSRPSAWLTNCGPERGAADADDQQLAELPAGPAISPLWTLAAKSLMAARVAVISSRISGVGASCGRAQPVMADHAVLVGIGDGALFQGGHGGERLLHRRLHAGEEVVRKGDPADVEGEPEAGGSGSSGP